MGNPGPSGKPSSTHGTYTAKGGPTPPKDQTANGPLPQEIQECCKLVGNSYVIEKTDDGPANLASVFPTNVSIVHMLDQRLGKVLLGRGAGLPGAILKRVMPQTPLLTPSPTASAKGSCITPTSPLGWTPPVTGASGGGGGPP